MNRKKYSMFFPSAISDNKNIKGRHGYEVPQGRENFYYEEKTGFTDNGSSSGTFCYRMRFQRFRKG